MEFDNPTNPNQFNTESICRACLETLCGTQRDLLQSPSLFEKFEACTSLAVETSDGLPLKICEPCYKKLDQFYEFREMCISSTQRCRDLIASNQNVTLEISFEDSKLAEPLVLLTETKQELCDDVDIFEAIQDFRRSDSSNISEDNNIIESGTLKVECELSEDKESTNDPDYEDYKTGSENDNDISGSSGSRKKDVKPAKRKRKPKIKSESAEPVLECETCKRRFQKTFMLAAHRRIHEGLTTFPCEQCDKVFHKIIRLRKHFYSVHESKQRGRHVCPEEGCGKSYGLKQTLKQHFKDVHENSGEKQKPQFICEVCGKALSTNTALKNHRYLHNNQQLPYECDQCQRRFITSHKYKEHMKRHAGIRNYICPHCGARKSTRTELNVHVNYHTKEKAYPCRFCEMVFNNTGNRLRHVRTVHAGIKDYPCKYCDKTFGKAETRKHHEMTHTGEKPHECKVCQRRFIQPVALRRHMKTHTNTTPSE